MRECEQLAGAAEALHLVHPHRDLRGLAAAHQRDEELARSGVEAALALHQLEQHRGDTAGIALQMRVERGDALRDRVRILGAVEGHEQRISAEWQTLAVGRLVRELGQRERAPGEAALEGDHVLRGMMLLEHDLEGVLVGDGAGDRKPDVAQARTRVAQQRARELEVLDARQQVTLEYAVACRGDDGGLEQIRVGVAEAVGADAAGEVEHGDAVGEAHARAAAGPARQRRMEQRAAAQALHLTQRALVGLGRELAFAQLLLHRLDEGPRGLAHLRCVEQASERAVLLPAHGNLERIGPP